MVQELLPVGQGPDQTSSRTFAGWPSARGLPDPVQPTSASRWMDYFHGLEPCTRLSDCSGLCAARVCKDQQTCAGHCAVQLAHTQDDQEGNQEALNLSHKKYQKGIMMFKGLIKLAKQTKQLNLAILEVDSCRCIPLEL